MPEELLHLRQAFAINDYRLQNINWNTERAQAQRVTSKDPTDIKGRVFVPFYGRTVSKFHFDPVLPIKEVETNITSCKR